MAESGLCSARMRRVSRFLSSPAFGWLALALGIALRLAWAVAFDPNPVNDGKWYLARSTEIASGLGYQVSGLPTAYWPVGYPALLGLVFHLFGTKLEVMRLTQVVLSAATLSAVGVVTRRLSDSRMAGNLAVLLFALYPTDVAYTGLMLTELSFNTWMMIGVATGSFARNLPLRAAGAGVSFALAALTRPQGLLLPVLVGVFGPWPSWRIRVLMTAGMLAAMCAALSPWWIRNARAFDAFVPVSNNGGVNLFIGNNPRAHGAYRLDGKVERGGRPEYEMDREYARRAREYIAANPARTLRLWPRKLKKLLEGDVAPIGWSRSMAQNKVDFVSSLGSSMERYYFALWGLAVPALILSIAGKQLALPVLHGLLACAFGWYFGLEAWIVISSTLLAELTALTMRRGPENLLRNLRKVPLAMLLSVIGFTLVFFGDFRFHHAMMPWAAIAAATLVAQCINWLASSDEARTSFARS